MRNCALGNVKYVILERESVRNCALGNVKYVIAGKHGCVPRGEYVVSENATYLFGHH